MAAHLNVLLVYAHADPHEHVLGALHHLPIDSQQVGSLQGLQQSSTRHVVLTSGFKVHGRHDGTSLLQRLKQPEMLCLPHRQLIMAAQPTKQQSMAGRELPITRAYCPSLHSKAIREGPISHKAVVQACLEPEVVVVKVPVVDDLTV